jgi:hypothetical protein
LTAAPREIPTGSGRARRNDYEDDY